jgi:hypothetical protein
MRTIATVSFALLFLGLYSCGEKKPMENTAPDYDLVYHWSEGSLPPQYYYNFEVHLSSGGTDSVEYYFGYSDSVYYSAQFSLSEEQEKALDSLLAAFDVTKQRSKLDDPPVGGSYSYLEGTVSGKSAAVPAFAEDYKELETLYKFIRSLIPESVVTTAGEKHKEYNTQKGLSE